MRSGILALASSVGSRAGFGVFLARGVVDSSWTAVYLRHVRKVGRGLTVTNGRMYDRSQRSGGDAADRHRGTCPRGSPPGRTTEYRLWYPSRAYRRVSAVNRIT